ncbi:MAG: hypothetical protein ACKOQ6_01850, partial [Bacteroidota bacterium]
MRVVFILLSTFLISANALIAQSAEKQLPSKDSIAAEVKRIQRGEEDQIRRSASERLDRIVLEFLKADSNIGKNPEIATNISCANSPDERWRLFSWVVPSYSGDRYQFHGYLQWRSADGKRTFLQRLNDSTSVIRKPDSERLTPDRWFGAAYYAVIHKRKKRKDYYMLLGWKGRDQQTTQKVIEVLSFDGDKPRFGYPLFKKERVFKSRVVFTFMSQVSMSLRYESS